MAEPAPETLVVRFGPFATEFPTWRDRVARELAELQAAGKRVVVVHAGGPRVDELLARLGKRPAWVGGKPVADPATFQLHEMVATAVGKDIVAAVQKHRGRAIGVSGRDGAILLASREGSGGSVAAVDADALRELLEDGFLPVLTAIGTDADGHGVVVRADEVAAAVAGALQASTLVMLDAEDGVWVHGRRVPRLAARGADLLASQDGVSLGMAATLTACAQALDAGVGQARIVDVRHPGALARAADPDADVGTAISPGAKLPV